MTVLHRVIVCMVFVAALAVPRTAHAGLGDLIWEMSGPQLLGFGLECDVWSLQDDPYCRLVDRGFSGSRQDQRRVWLNVEARAYFSTGKNQKKNNETIEFGWFQTWMVAADPVLTFGYNVREVRVRHGAGGSFNWLMGEFAPFGNIGLKLRPIVIQFNAGGLPLEITYNVRLYRDGFDGDPLRPDRLSKGEAFERVHSFGVGVPLGSLN